MRSAVALQICVGLVMAFLAAPFQHVHAGDADHDRGLIHSHLYSVSSGFLHHHDGRSFDETDDDHATARQLDTFTPMVAAGTAPSIPSGNLAELIVPRNAFDPVELVEARGHDPPGALRTSSPRAPPSSTSGQ